MNGYSGAEQDTKKQRMVNFGLGGNLGDLEVSLEKTTVVRELEMREGGANVEELLRRARSATLLTQAGSRISARTEGDAKMVSLQCWRQGGIEGQEEWAGAGGCWRMRVSRAGVELCSLPRS